ncbi:MAG: restriction endonuclease subunit S [Candidatus Rokubacteria bacterium]|nr:restriction endonuclease subunit S [Candidatus Rokubacteria bacterium]
MAAGQDEPRHSRHRRADRPGRQLPRRPPPDERRRPGSVPILGSFGITGWHNEAKARGPGVTVGRSGASFGVVSYSPVDFWPLNTALYVVDFHGNDERFMYYFLKLFDFKAYNSGSAQPSLNRNFVHPVPVEVPPLPEQRAIAHVLGTLDDKIELNRRMNETLEAMAWALFESWFVDFDPVRAKAEGRDPGQPKEISDLFPDSFDDSELGEIPAGWRVESLGKLIELAYGKALKEENRRPGQIPVFGSNGQVGWHDEKLADGPGIIVGRKGNPGVITWAPSDFFAIDTTFYVVPKDAGQSLYFLFYALSTHDLASLGADSAVPGLNRNLAYMNLQMVPRPAVREGFDKQVQPIFEQRNRKDQESRTLAALRDTLLPKLISGAW